MLPVRRTTKALLAAGLGTVLLVVGQSGFAAPTDSKLSSQNRGVAVFLVETTVVDGTSERSFWWKNPSEPNWSKFDQSFKTALGNTPYHLVVPEPIARISGIYRSPDLSGTQLARFAEIIDAPHALSGEVRLELNTEGHPLGSIKGDVEVVVRDASDGAVDAGERTIRIRRTLYGKDRTELAERLRHLAAEALANQIGWLIEPGGSVQLTPDLNETLIEVHGAGKSLYLQKVRTFLEQRSEVSQTRIRWAAAGQIVMEINPSRADSDESIDKHIEALVAEEFEDFRVVDLRPSETTRQVRQLRIE